MASRIAMYRNNAYSRQSGCCYYCGFHMWSKDPKTFADKYSLSSRLASRFQCTGEHLHARRDGGLDRSENIVAACKYCNQHRHKRKSDLGPVAFKRHVQARLNAGGWHPMCVRQVMSSV